jgi:tetraacyldisaccharide 4'-kinase
LNIAKIRHKITRPYKLNVPIVCVGNVVVGGGGKTPSVICLAQMLRQYGKNPYIISRGYKAKNKRNILVSEMHTALEVGDEPLLLAKVAPTIIGKNRRLSAKMAIKLGANVIIMDDGLQNNSLHKDLSILMIDGGYGFGNGEVLPAGPLREPVADAVAKTELVILVGRDEANIVNQLPKNAKLMRANMQLNTDTMPQKVVAFCGIARPLKFYDSLKETGFELLQTYDFPDHHFFGEAELQEMFDYATRYNVILVTTEKDWVRLSDDWRLKIVPIKADLNLSNSNLLVAALEQNNILKLESTINEYRG